MNDYSVSYSQPATAAPNPAALVIILLVALAFYVYMAYALYTMAKKTNTQHAWMAWVPLLNVYLMVKIAGKPGWWLVLFFIPFLNIVFAIIVWYYIAERLGKPGWVGVLMIVPLVNLVIPGYLAFSATTVPAPSAVPPVMPPPAV